MKFLRKLTILLVLLGSMAVCASAESLAVERQIYDYLTNIMGLPSASACGILANIEHESAFNPTALGDGGTSYGICQWHAGRYTALKTYCQSAGMDYRSVDGQLSYLRYELETNYTELLSILRVQTNDANGAYRAGYLWCIQFERPADMENKAIQRGTLARGKYWNRYNSLILVRTEEEEPLTVEEVVKIVQQTEVTVPQPPEGTTVERYVEEDDTLVLPVTPYIARHLPRAEQTQPRVHPATALAVSLLFLPLSDGKKEAFCLPAPEEAVCEV